MPEGLVALNPALPPGCGRSRFAASRWTAGRSSVRVADGGVAILEAPPGVTVTLRRGATVTALGLEAADRG